MRTALTIAGSDSGGGAGIQADLKTFAAHGVYGTSALTAITAQNTRGVLAWEAVSTPLVVQQIEAVLGDIGADAIKIGMLANAEIVSAVARTLASRASLPIVVDPVMIAKGGDRLLETAAVAALKTELLPLAHTATPNIPEAEALAGMPIRSLADMRLAGDRIRRLGPRIVLVKGGHAEGDESIDVAVMEAETIEIRGPRLLGRHTHGTGCTLSSAIAANLAKGMAVEAAIRAARQYLEGAIRHAPQIGDGHGPLNHSWRHEAGGYTDWMAGQAASSPSEAAGRKAPFRVTLEPLDLLQAAQAVTSPDCGGVATFVGVVRDHNQGRQVRWLDYECYEPLAVKALQRIAAEAAVEWPGARLSIAHRVGSLQLGDASVVIAAASPHRADAFAVCRYAIERIKQIVPIWKHEHFDGGETWIEGATADPDDEAAKRIALERAQR